MKQSLLALVLALSISSASAKPILKFIGPKPPDSVIQEAIRQATILCGGGEDAVREIIFECDAAARSCDVKVYCGKWY